MGQAHHHYPTQLFALHQDATLHWVTPWFSSQAVRLQGSGCQMLVGFGFFAGIPEVSINFIQVSGAGQGGSGCGQTADCVAVALTMVACVLRYKCRSHDGNS